MFSFPAKRRRDDQIDDLEERSLHERKKPRPLPLRFSPSSKHATLFLEDSQLPPRSIPPALTPVESSDDEDDGDGMSQSTPQAARNRRPDQGCRPPALTLDTAMDVDMPDSHPLFDGDNLSPWPVSAKSNGSLQPSPIPHQLINQSLNISGGRTATPIYSHFTVNMHLETVREDDQTLPTHSSVSEGPDAQKNGQTDWWRRRRLPSPISEDEDALVEQNCNLQSHSLPISPPSTGPCNAQTGAWPPISEPSTEDCAQSWKTSNTSMEASAAATLQSCASSVNMASNSSQSAAGTNRTSGSKKISFSMGYRADCDKCRRKVPGHYSHIIRS